MASSIRRALNEAAISTGAIGLLVLVLAASDPRVREQVALHLSSKPGAEIANAGDVISRIVVIVFDAARDQTIAHAPLVLFVVAAGALLLFMLRT